MWASETFEALAYFCVKGTVRRSRKLSNHETKPKGTATTAVLLFTTHFTTGAIWFQSKGNRTVLTFMASFSILSYNLAKALAKC